MIQELMRIQGMYEIVQQTQSANEAQVRQEAKNMIEDLRSKFSTLPEPIMADLMRAVNTFTKSATGGWSASEAVEQWERLYGAEMSSEDVSRVLEFYKSPVGQRDIAATKVAMPNWAVFFAERSAVTTDKAMKAYVAEVQQIVSRATVRK